MKKDQIWDVEDRHGNMTIRLLEDVDLSQDTFFEAIDLDGVELFEGNKQIPQALFPHTIVKLETSEEDDSV